MSTYYKEFDGTVVYRIAAGKITYIKDDGTVTVLPLTGGGGGSSDWADITGKPAFIGAGASAAAARTAIGAIAIGDVPAAPTWSTISGKPAVVAEGANAGAARTAITAAASGANSDITSLTGLTTALSAAQGGTGVTNVNDLATALNISAFMPGLAPTISNVDTWTTGGIRSMTTSTTGRPTGTANGDMIMNFVSATNAAQLAFLMTTGNLVYRVFTTSWQPWQNVTKAALG